MDKPVADGGHLSEEVIHSGIPKQIFRAEEIVFGVPSVGHDDQANSVSDFITKVSETWAEASVESSITHLNAQNLKLDGRTIKIDGKEVVHFGSCSYLGLELDARLREEAKAAIDNYGTQFSSSVAYLSIDLYRQLRDRLTSIFNSDVAIGPTTTLAHFACIPTIGGAKDAFLLDQQVHNSVQLACETVRSKVAYFKVIPHNRLDLLEKTLQKLSPLVDRVWYFMDGVYSMFGDVAPIEALSALKQKYPKLYLYVDDAHGMSWAGEHGSGYVWSKFEDKSRLILVVSLAKGFGSAGGVVVSNEVELLQNIRKFGPTMIFSGPIQPAVLGASIASAGIHLSPEILVLQENLSERISYRNLLIEKYNLPSVGISITPISFIQVGDHIAAGKLFARLKASGFYVNWAGFPAVSNNRSGIRFTITRHHTLGDIERLICSINDLLPSCLENYNIRAS